MKANRKLPPHIIQWFKERGITEGILEVAGIDYERNKIVIPIVDSKGDLLFNKYRRDPRVFSGPKYQYDKGGTEKLYGLHFIDRSDKVIICEGELDVLLLAARGFSAVSTTGGAGSFKPEWVNDLLGKEVFICYDNDEAGIKGAFKVQELIPWAKIVWLTDFVKDGGDITDYFNSGETPANLRGLMIKALRYKIPKKITGSSKADIKRQIAEYRNYIDEVIMPEARKLRGDMKSDKHLQFYIELWLQRIREAEALLKRGLRVTPQDTTKLLEAKTRPISDYIDFNRRGFAKCIWHPENTPSMYYYSQTNKVKCFGCDKMGDVLDVVQQIKNCSLPEAIKFINEEDDNTTME